MTGDWTGLPANCVLAVYAQAGTPKDAAAWRLSCKSFYEVCGRVDMLQLRVVGDDKAAAAALDASSGDISTWFGLDLDFAPMELVQQVRRARRRRAAALTGRCAARRTPLARPPVPSPQGFGRPSGCRGASPRRLCCGRSRPSWWSR